MQQEAGRHMELAETLQALGTSRIEATLVAYMVSHREGDTKTIIEHTGLRQPEVSVGMRSLRERGWVETHAIPGEGRGRPMNAYSLAVATKSVCEHYEHYAETTIRRTKRALETLVETMGQADSRCTPSEPARKTASHRPRNRPHSTTPG